MKTLNTLGTIGFILFMISVVYLIFFDDYFNVAKIIFWISAGLYLSCAIVLLIKDFKKEKSLSDEDDFDYDWMLVDKRDGRNRV